jgi:precorrin-2 methylase
MSARGQLACVGVGMTLGAHLTPSARSQIEQADVVFVAVSDALVELWIQRLHPDVRSLQPFYCEGSSRQLSYDGMLAAILTEVRAQRRVCAAFYGHPGVFAWVAHESIRVARAEGYSATMLPGISAEDCLYADLGIDPGSEGITHLEATQLMLYTHRLDPGGYLVLWQVGIAGDRSLARFSTGSAYREILRDVLLRDYPANHPIIIYRAATLATARPRIESTSLEQLPFARIELADTVVLPPATKRQSDPRIAARLQALDQGC